MNAPNESDRRFQQQFERCELAAAEFHHREHLRLAYVYLTIHPPEVALDTMRRGLQHFLAHVRAPASKYHETMTRAWLLAVHHFMHVTEGAASFDQFARSAPQLFDPRIMLTHYTSKLLTSDTARCCFVEPDLDPIPRYGADA